MRALVLGSADCLYTDRESVAWAKADKIYAVNYSGVLCRDADVWVIGHAEHLAMYQRKFLVSGRPFPEIVTGVHRRDKMEEDAHFDRWESPLFEGMTSRRFDSGLFGVRVAIKDGASKVILCGVPLSAGANLNGWTPEDHSYARYCAAWQEAVAHMSGRVKSCSGFTRDLLGGPTKEWWNEPRPADPVPPRRAV